MSDLIFARTVSKGLKALKSQSVSLQDQHYDWLVLEGELKQFFLLSDEVFSLFQFLDFEDLVLFFVL